MSSNHPSAAELQNAQKALDELHANRRLFSETTYQQLVLALHDRIESLGTLPQPRPILGNDNDIANGISTRDEIRLVTVMFVDIEDSTRLARRLEEEWKAFVDDFQQRLAQIIEEWDGEIGQYLGDGMLCFFGAHRSRDDDAARAVSCALAIQAMAADYATYVRERYHEAFALRVGISSGRVVVGIIGTGAKSEFVAMGAPTNLAARLQHLCPPGEVLIDSQTYHRVRDRFHIQAQTPITLKGFDQPIEHYLVGGQRQQRSATLASDEIAGIPLPFVGRNVEFGHLVRLWDDALAEEQFHVIMIAGETGVGKSRLLQETLSYAVNRPFTLLTMVASSEKRATPYNLLHDLVGGLCDLTDGTPCAVAEACIEQCIAATWQGPDADTVAAVIGQLAGFGFQDVPVRAVQPLAMVADWLRGLAEGGALLIAVDNLQWADPASLDMLEYLATALVDMSGVLIANTRPEFSELAPGFMSTCARYTEMTLGRLNDDATRLLIDSVLQHVENAPPLLAEDIAQRSAGNPLFVEEFLRMLFDNGVFERNGAGGWQTNRVKYGTLTPALPNGLTGVFQARLDDLPALARRVVQIASVLGDTFWEGGVSAMSDMDMSAILEGLVRRRILVPIAESSWKGQREYRFRHTLYREVAYAMLTRADRETFHQRAADWLMQFVEERPENLGTLAEHLTLGQRRDQALAVYLAAAVDRTRRGLAAEALKLVDSGLALGDDVPQAVGLPLISQLWMWRAQLLNTLRRYDEARAAGQTALMLMNELPAAVLANERQHAARILAETHQHLTEIGRARIRLPGESVR